MFEMFSRWEYNTHSIMLGTMLQDPTDLRLLYFCFLSLPHSFVFSLCLAGPFCPLSRFCPFCQFPGALSEGQLALCQIKFYSCNIFDFCIYDCESLKLLTQFWAIVWHWYSLGCIIIAHPSCPLSPLSRFCSFCQFPGGVKWGSGDIWQCQILFVIKIWLL